MQVYYNVCLQFQLIIIIIIIICYNNFTCILSIVGKTSILERIKSSHGLTSLKPEQIPPTVGMNLARLNIKGNTVIFWDLGGQIKMRSKYY